MPYAPIPILLLLLYGTFLLAVRSGLRRQFQTFCYHSEWKGDFSPTIAPSRRSDTICDYRMNEHISNAVAILRESPASSDHEIYRRAVAAGIEPKQAARLVEFLPMAYCRLILAITGARLSDKFQRRQHNGSLSHEERLASNPLWAEIMSYARAEQAAGAAGKDLLVIASHSAEFDAVNKLLNRGSKLQDIALSTAVPLWPEEGPTP